MSQRRGSTKDLPARAKSRRAGLWGPLCIMVLVLVLGWFGTPAQRRPSLANLEPDWWPSEWNLDVFPSGDVAGARQGAQASLDQAWIYPAELQWTLADTCDPRWSEELSARMGELAPFPVDDELGFQELIETLDGISFVAAVLGAQPDPELGLDLELVLREPVACVPSNGLFYPVDEQGVLLSGSWEKPMYCRGLPLPVLGPISDGFGLFSMARPGDWLVEAEHLDALGVALSMAEHLSPLAREAMGRMVIDATQGQLASVANPGVQLLLGGRRLILFGRPVNSNEPGELPVATKWNSLENCLLGERAAVLGGWGLLDLRWDNPEVDLEPILLAQVSSEASGIGRAGPRRSAPSRGSSPSPRRANSRVR